MTFMSAMYEFGTIVLVSFPFTDLSAAKVRPALIVSESTKQGEDVIVCFISSNVGRGGEHAVSLSPDTVTGLKVRSVVRFDKIATLHKRVILGKLGAMSKNELHKHRTLFYSVFGF